MSSKTLRLNEDDIQSISQSSDEKMDTGSESIISNTPNSVRSSDFEDRDPIESRAADEAVLRLQEPHVVNCPSLDESLVTNMSNLYLDSPITGQKSLGKSPPRLSSLTLTMSHPLMGVTSPDEIYPDLIPKKKTDDEKLSLSSAEEEKLNDTNGYHFYPERNTSKNNLYFENCLGDPQIVEIDVNPPDVARVQEKLERRKIIPKLTEARKPEGALRRIMNCSADSNKEYCAIINEKFIKLNNHSTPRTSLDIGVPKVEQLHSGVPEWCDSPSQQSTIPNFELPIELSSTIYSNKGRQSPDAMSSSTQDEPSSYQALLDPYTGSVALHHSQSRCSSGQRRKIRAQLTEEQDRCSLDSVSGCSLESEDEPPEPPEPEIYTEHSDDDAKKSTHTISELSEPIPEYSAAEEFRDERSWLSVPRPEGRVKCDMKVIEPFKRVISHGGYDACGAALVVFSACHLPDSARPDYRYVMDNLFLYVIWTLDRLITDEYVLVYLHGSAGRRKLPNCRWMHECYKLIDRRLRKSLKHLYLVHPTFWLRSFVVLSKPFVSSKFFRKMSYVRCLSELFERIPVEPNAIPELVKAYDARR